VCYNLAMSPMEEPWAGVSVSDTRPFVNPNALDDERTAANTPCRCGHGKGAHHTGVYVRTFSQNCGAADCECPCYEPCEAARTVQEPVR
jgi:hypothetical protein